ncbi:YiiX/YebB-like N1pC/P60 family cysteine hydrolase [Camelimonas sp. ID_303_24]
MDSALSWLGRKIAAFLMQELPGYRPSAPPDPAALARALQPGDVLLVEGATRIASIIKYLTQSSWSHAALYVGPVRDQDDHVLVEADVQHGVTTAPLSKYAAASVRICRPVALTPDDRDAVVAYARSRIGQAYDLRNVIDLGRYLLPLPAPSRFRRRMIALGSGEPTRAICSTLIAQAFEQVRYPVLPRLEIAARKNMTRFTRAEILHIRHHSLFAPRDFDISPYFAIVKPTIETGFDYKQLVWSADMGREAAPDAADGASAGLLA